MSFREKSAWITLVTVLVCFGIYFGAIIGGWVDTHGFGAMHLLLACVAGLIVLQIGLKAVAAATTPKDGLAPRDEREDLIQGRAHSLGYYVLTGLVVTLFIPVHLGHSAIDLANFALLAVVLATLAVAGAQIVMFRRGT
jgi:formate hydrogenlyase subunit 4